MQFTKANNMVGWIAFGIALLTYWLTFEETMSYWDCGEFIAVSYKLEVSHPPGAPMFMLVGRLFSFLALGDVTRVAYWINFSSVLASAFTVLFLFWSITLLGRKLWNIKNPNDLQADQTWLLMGAGLVGALAYTFSDSFWFSAVEAEVYAMSSFFTALVVWLILKWEIIEDEAKANRWLILTAYMVGLSIGFHLLNLLALPALGLIYYFKKYKPSKWGVAAALALSGGLVLFINDFIIPGLPTLAGGFEVFFVNNLGLPFGSGVFVFMALLTGGLVYGIWYSHSKSIVLLNTFLLSVAFILIGYASYTTIVIRSNFDPPINENAPKDVMSFVRYLKREQYGSRPLLSGPYFTAQIIDVKQGAPVYTKGKDKYEITDRKMEYVYDPAHTTVFPRMWNEQYAESYRQIAGLREGEKPTFAQNLMYLFSHQIGTQYIRYFMWNFAGRESDEQGAGWLTPLQWFEDIPSELAENRGRNNFFMIPFLLGLIGMFYQFTKDTKGFAVVGILFVLLGVAIVVYLNTPPQEPRERDYIYAGSTYAYTFWIGLAVIAVADALQKLVRRAKTAAVIATLICLSGPAIMAFEGWDDHNRSDRFFSVDSAKNYLSSCAPNAILFTGGDNDTFPLWYAQEVEGFRTDVRVIVLSYYNTDWYIEQTMRATYESQPFPYTLSLKDYRHGGPNDYLPFADMKLNAIDLKQYIELLSKNFRELRSGDRNIVPSKNFLLNVDTARVRALGFVPKNLEKNLLPQMSIRLKGNGLEKKDLAFLDLLATNNWERPLYVNFTSMSQFNLDLRPYAIAEGMAYRIIPVRNPNPDADFVNTETMYDNVINQFAYRGLDNPAVYYNEDYRGFVLNHRSVLNTLAEALIREADQETALAGTSVSIEGPIENKMEKARKVLLFNLEKMPDAAVPYDESSVETVSLLFQAGEKEKALDMAGVIGARATEMVNYLMRKNEGLTNNLRKNMVILAVLQRILYDNGENDLAKKLEETYEQAAAGLGVQ
jgi:hypothetical protein